MTQLDQVKKHRSSILSAVNFKPGYRYQDYNPHTDRVAEYGLAALVAGGVLSKVGFFKSLLGMLITGKKVLLLGGIAFLGLIGRRIKKAR